MKYWRDIVNHGSLGTAKAPVAWNSMPAFLQEAIEQPTPSDAEDEFLIIASLAYQYRVGAFTASPMVHTPIPLADPETQTYTSATATSLFKLVLSEDLPALTGLWIELCQRKGLIAQPEIVPDLLDLGVKRKEYRPSIKTIVGKRGEWLARLNPDWQVYIVSDDAAELWQTGSPDQRKELLKGMRATNPPQAIELLKSTWETEGANEKTAFLDLLRVNLSASDLPWLESLKEKSQKVTGVIHELLKSIPTSSLVEKYKAILKVHVRMKSGKALLGMINKTSIEVDEQLTIPDEIFKTGIDKLSSDKNIADHQHIIAQLIGAVPPAFWCEHFNEEPKVIIEVFRKEKQTALYVQALAQAAIRFHDTAWLESLLTTAKRELMLNVAPLMIQLLPQPQAQEFALKLLDEKPHEIIHAMTQQTHEWSVPLAKAILKFTASEVYAYNKSFYRPAIALIPVAVIHELDSFTPAEEQKRAYWATQAEELKRLLELKKQVIQSF